MLRGFWCFVLGLRLRRVWALCARPWSGGFATVLGRLTADGAEGKGSFVSLRLCVRILWCFRWFLGWWLYPASFGRGTA
jgi:hypothetical protein